MSTRRKRRAAERRLAKSGKRAPVAIWAIIVAGLVLLAVVVARSLT